MNKLMKNDEERPEGWARLAKVETFQDWGCTISYLVFRRRKLCIDQPRGDESPSKSEMNNANTFISIDGVQIFSS